MRFSCRVIFRIMNAEGHYLLMLDKELLSKYGPTPEGMLLVPPGGYIQATPQGIDRLQRIYGAFGFESALDLRFYTDRSRLEPIRGWFMDRYGSDRETDIKRLATELFWQDPFYGKPFAGMSALRLQRMLLGTSTDVGQTVRPHVAEAQTMWLIDTFEVTLGNWRMTHALNRLTATSGTPLHFVSAYEIEQGQTHLGYPIDQRLARRLLAQDVAAGH